MWDGMQTQAILGQAIYVPGKLPGLALTSIYCYTHEGQSRAFRDRLFYMQGLSLRAR
jgi:hypothetical protein